MPADDELLRFSYSAVSTWLQCRQKWMYNYKLGLVPLITDSRPVIGSAVHFALGMAILLRRPGQPDGTFGGLIDGALDVWFEEQMQRYQGLPEGPYDEIHEMMSDFCEKASFIARRALSVIRIDDWETCIDRAGTPMVEWHFDREVPGIGLLTGDIDWVARHRPTDTIWLWDHKIRARLSNALAEDFNTQMGLYQHVLTEDEGMTLAGSITFQVSSKIPSVPRLNKNGTMARSAIDTDWATYERALLDAHLDPADYQDMQIKLEAKRFFDPTRFYRSREHAEAIWGQIFVPAAREMRDALYGDPSQAVVRSMSSFSCRGCPYVPLCIGELRGQDMTYTARTQYALKDTSALLAGAPTEGEDDNSALDG